MSKNKRLNSAQLKRLEQQMRRVQAGGGLNLEQTDGFFAGLVCLPNPAEPDEFFEVVFGHAEEEWESAAVDVGAGGKPPAGLPELPMQGAKLPPVEPTDELLDMLLALYDSKMMAQKNGIFYSNPLLVPDEQGESTARDWARGFLDCLAWDGCLDELDKLIEHEDENEESPLTMAFVALMALASGGKPADTYEDNDADTSGAAPSDSSAGSGSPNSTGSSVVDDATDADDSEDLELVPLEPEELQNMINALPECVNLVYQTLRGVKSAPLQATSRKIPRNSPCPCGSGKKYKQCCLLKEE